MSDTIVKLTFNKSHQQAVRELSGDAYRIWSYVQLQSDSWKPRKKDICKQLDISPNSYSQILMPELRTKGWVHGHNTDSGWVNEFYLHPALNPHFQQGSRFSPQLKAPFSPQLNPNSINNNSIKESNKLLSAQGGLEQVPNTPAGGDVSDNHDKSSHDDNEDSMWDKQDVRNFDAMNNQLRNNAGKRETPEVIRPEKPVIAQESKSQSTTTSNPDFVPTLHETQLLELITSDQHAAVTLYLLRQGENMPITGQLSKILDDLKWATKTGLTSAKKKTARIDKIIAKIKPVWVAVAQQKLQEREAKKKQEVERRRGITDVLVDAPFRLVNGHLGRVTKALMELTPDNPVTGTFITEFVNDWQRKGLHVPLGDSTLPSALLRYRDEKAQTSNMQFNFVD